MKKNLYLSPNYSKKKRLPKDIKFVVIHYTGMQSEIESINRLISKKSKVSCHYLINRKGQVLNMVPDKKVAWHAGKSKWKKFKNLNNISLGIELVNRGHNFGYQNYTNPQIIALINLCKRLKKKYNIENSNFLGHSDIAPNRKIDPGEKFPWKKLSKFNLGIWYKKQNLKIGLKDKKKLNSSFFNNLHKIGYRYFHLHKRFKKNDRLIIRAFQQRFNPTKVSGNIDKKTFEISCFLANQ
tara:strand:+ start:3482 stop:4198 length:717 start_codon:yes stop_codon:yes gene_type:complete